MTAPAATRSRYCFDSEHHVHTLDGRRLTGCSSVGEVLAKPLTWWAAGLALEPLGWTKPNIDKKPVPPMQRLLAAQQGLYRLQGMEPEDYLALLDKGYRAHNEFKNKAAAAGTDRHALVEVWVRAQLEGEPEPSLAPAELSEIQPYIAWSKANVTRYLWSESNCYSEQHWVGGVSDIGCELNDGRLAIVDIKSSKEAYDNQFFQIGGYDLCIAENGWFTAAGEKLGSLHKPVDVHIVFPFGMKNPTGIESKDVAGNREAFLAELVLYCRLNGRQL